MAEHAYFEALLTRPDFWLERSFREAAHMNPPGLVYDPAMDAGRVTIYAFYDSDALDGAVDAVTTDFPINTTNIGLYNVGRVFKVDHEIVTTVQRLNETHIRVTRATFGTVAEPHAAGAIVRHATNSVKPVPVARVRLGTEDGHTYFFTWDAYWTASYMNAGRFNHKAFQFSSGSQDGDAIWFEPQVFYGQQPGAVGVHQYRTYNTAGGPADWALSDGNQVGPGTQSPLGPQTQIPIVAGKWTRFFLHIEQRQNNYDVVSAWMADEDRNPVPVFSRLLISVRPTGATPNSIHSFWVEFNSSENALLRLDQRELVAYVRNFVALRDVADVSSLLVRPAPGAVPTWRPRPPTNLRVA